MGGPEVVSAAAAWVTVRDGTRLAVDLYRPATKEPVPCLVEALPYRKDDLTSSYAATYERLREEFGFAVCRVDLRGTGSSEGDADDEYPPVELDDLADVVAWLAGQPWCNGRVGLFGTSYSGFNALQLACTQPPALGAVCASYASDDRWTDDVHWRGGALKLVDLVDYCHYMTPMAMLPPVPAVWGGGWRDEWRRRIERTEPWVLQWLPRSCHDDYWAHGSVRLQGGERGYDRIRCPTMIVAGWADGYRNSTFRAIDALGRAGTPHRLLAGPWAHADPTTAMPGPRIDFLPEMAAWFGRWLRGDEGGEVVSTRSPSGSRLDHQGGSRLDHQGGARLDHQIDVFVRTSTRPAADLDLHAGFWSENAWPPTGSHTITLDGPRTLDVEPDVGIAAWIDCAGHLPWGQSGDQREDDARSLTWDAPPPDRAVVGYPTARLRVSADQPAASLSVKLCDVFPDGTSALVGRGTLDLRFRNGLHGPPEPLVPGEVYDVEVVLDACAYRFDEGQTLRVSVAGSDWPNTVAPPAPVTLTWHGGALDLPLSEAQESTGGFRPGADRSAEDPEGVDWTVTRDVLRQVTSCEVRHGSSYDLPSGGRADERYWGRVGVDRRTFVQWAEAECSFGLSGDGYDVRVTSAMRVDVTEASYDVHVTAQAEDGGVQIAGSEWHEVVPRH